MTTMREWIKIVSGGKCCYAARFAGTDSVDVRLSILSKLIEKYCADARVVSFGMPGMEGILAFDATMAEAKKLQEAGQYIADRCHFAFEIKRVPE